MAKLLCQSESLFWIIFSGLILLVITSSNTLGFFVRFFSPEACLTNKGVMTIGVCSSPCRGRWQAGARMGFGGCAGDIVTPGLQPRPQPGRVLGPKSWNPWVCRCAPTLACARYTWGERWPAWRPSPCSFWAVNVFLALGSSTKFGKILAQKLTVVLTCWGLWDPYLMSYAF